jgi:hypothetical protein
VRLVACAFVVACSAVACSAGGGDAQGGSATTTAPAGPPADPTCVAFHGTEGPLQSYGDRPPALLVDVSVLEVGCLDRVTFEFLSLGDGTPPGYTVTYRDLEKDPLINAVGGVIELPARMALIVELTPARSIDTRLPDAPQTYKGPIRLSYGRTHHIDVVYKLDDDADSVRWVIGVDGVRPFVVDSAVNPTRVSVYIG